jgi:hypothetical protein
MRVTHLYYHTTTSSETESGSITDIEGIFSSFMEVTQSQIQGLLPLNLIRYQNHGFLVVFMNTRTISSITGEGVSS